MSFTPATFDSPQTNANGPKKRRIWPWVVFPLGCITLIGVCCCGGLGMLGFGVFAALKSSEPYQTGLKRVLASEDVKDAIGEPIKPSFLVQGNINLQNENGEADITFPVTGPRGTAQVHVRGTRAGGKWRYDEISVTLDEGAVIDLSKEPIGRIRTVGEDA